MVEYEFWRVEGDGVDGDHHTGYQCTGPCQELWYGEGQA
jgi:hypothetical protein